MSGIRKFKAIALDTNIFIYNLEQNPAYITSTDIIFKHLVSNQLKGATSIITLTEILSYPQAGIVAKQIIDDFLNTPNLTVAEVNQQIAIEAARIRREYGFRLPDSIQLATALSIKAQAFVTNDKLLKSFKELKIISLNEIKV